MKKIFASLLFLGLVFAGAFYAGREGKMRVEKKEKPAELVSAFQPSPYPLQNQSFVVVITGCNNGASVEKTLRSVFSQSYDNYRVIYVDDASDDGSFDLARELIYESGQRMRVALVQNERRVGALASLARAVRSCQDAEIVLVVGGEDWLAHEWVLSRLNQYYANPALWMTYGQYREYPQYAMGFSKSMAEGNVRQMPFSASHLKSFYAGLFKKIPEKDLKEEDRFLVGATELAFMMPLLELAQGHSAFVPDVLYIANRTVKEDREVSVRCERLVRAMAPLPPLAKLEMAPIDPFVEAVP